MCIYNFRGFFPWVKPWHSRVEIWWSSLLNQKCNWKEKAFSLDHMVTTLNREDRSMHSKFTLSPIQTLSPTSIICLGLPGHRQGSVCIWATLILKMGKGLRIPSWERELAKTGKLSWVSNAEDAGGGSKERSVCCHGHGEANDQWWRPRRRRGDLSGPWAHAEKSTLETDWVGGLNGCSKKTIFNPKGKGIPLEALEEETHRQNVENSSIDQRWCA